MNKSPLPRFIYSHWNFFCLQSLQAIVYWDDLNQLIRVGDVPNLYSTEEKSEIIENMRNIDQTRDKSLQVSWRQCLTIDEVSIVVSTYHSRAWLFFSHYSALYTQTLFVRKLWCVFTVLESFLLIFLPSDWRQQRSSPQNVQREDPRTIAHCVAGERSIWVCQAAVAGSSRPAPQLRHGLVPGTKIN
jgi:hypothetical protein